MSQINIIGLLIVGFLTALIIVFIVDIKQLRRLNKLIYSYEPVLSVEKYHELKWRIDLFISIASVASIMIGYLGVSFKNITEGQISRIETRVGKLDSILASREMIIDSLDQIANSINVKYNRFGKRIGTIQGQVENLNEANLRKWEFSIIPDVPVQINSRKLVDTIYFKDIALLDGSKLPEFKTIPIVNIIKNEKVNWLFNHVETTKDFFVVKQSGTIDNNFKINSIDIWMLIK